MQEFIEIHTDFIKTLKKGEVFSESDAFLDLLVLKNEGGKCSRRELMKRWGWGSSKVANFIKKISEQAKNEPETNQKRTTFSLKNIGFEACEQATFEPEMNQKRTRCTEQKTIKAQEAIEMITDAWNELSSCGIKQIPSFGMTNLQYFNLTETIKTHSVMIVIETIQKIKQSDFLQGKNGGWRITFDWFVRLENFEKVLSGNYDWRNKNVQNQSKEKQMIDNHHNLVREWLEEQEANENE